MPLYRYKALSSAGVIARGEQAAVNLDDLHRQLAGSGLRVVSARTSGWNVPGFRSQRIKPGEFVLFVHELVALLRAGLSVPDALGLARVRPESPVLSELLHRVLADVRGGVAFSDACQRRLTFDPLFIAALKTAEKTGDLAAPLARYHDFLRRRLALRQKLTQAMVYPAVLLLTLVAVMAALFIFVMPRFAAMYADFDAPLPVATRMLLRMADELPTVLAAIGLITLVGFWAANRWLKAGAAAAWFQRAADSLPYVSELRRSETTALLARALSALLAGGTPLVEALAAARDALMHLESRRRLAQALEQVTAGSSLAQAARAARLMPETACKMIEVGEATGRLDAMISEVAHFYEDRLEQQLARTAALVEPLLMLLMGLMIGGIIIVMYLPIFSLAAVIR